MSSSKDFQYKYLYNGYCDLLEEEENEERQLRQQHQHQQEEEESHVEIAMDEFFDSDLMTQDMPMSLDLPGDPDMMMSQYMLEDCDFSDLLQADNHHSDSSDSGVNMVIGDVQIKQETQSNPSSPSSDTGSEGYISGQDAFINAVVKTEVAPDMGMGMTEPSPYCLNGYGFSSAQQAPQPPPPPCLTNPSPISSSFLSSPTSSSSSLSPTPTTPLSPAEQTLIYIPKEEVEVEEAEAAQDLSSATQLLLPSDLSQFPGSILSPSSSSSSPMLSSTSYTLSSSSSSSSSSSGVTSSDLLSSAMCLSSMPVQLDSILKQKVQILPKPNQGVVLGGKKVVVGGGGGGVSGGVGGGVSGVGGGAGGVSRLPVVSVPVSGKVVSVVTTAPRKVEPKLVTVKPAAAKKLVLTPEEFTKLTASGALRFQPPNSDPTNPVTTTTVGGGGGGGTLLPPPVAAVAAAATLNTTTSVTSFSDMLGAELGCGGGENMKSKRQQRMIKNRESASLSRKRKKEYLTSLEDKVRAYTTENQHLKMENDMLKSKVQQLHDENVQLRQTANSPSHKKAFLLVVAFFFTFNFHSFSSMLWWDQRPVSVSPPNPSWVGDPGPIRGRHLLSLADNSAGGGDPAHKKLRLNDDDDRGGGGNSTTRKGDDLLWQAEQTRRMLQFDADLQHLLTRGSLNESVVAAHFCPIYFNSTESSRLAEQLRGWMIREEEVKQKKHSPGEPQRRRKKAYPPVNILRAAMRGHYARDLGDPAYRSAERREGVEAGRQQQQQQQQQQFQMTVFQHNDPRQRLLNAIPRRNDTFYVLSFNTDYFLVPATAHNKTARPRMSLVMPVVSDTLNDTMQPPEGSVGMMQIDCEILNTHLIHVKKSAFPHPQQQHQQQQHQHQHHHQHQHQHHEQHQKSHPQEEEPQFNTSQYANHTGPPAEPPRYRGNQTLLQRRRDRDNSKGKDSSSVFEAPSRGSRSMRQKLGLRPKRRNNK